MSTPQPERRKQYVTVREAEKLLHRHERTVRRKIEKGQLHAIHDRDGGLHIDLDDINRILAERTEDVYPEEQHRDQMQAQIDDLIQQVESLQRQFDLLLQAHAIAPGEEGETAQMPLPLNFSSLVAALARKHRDPRQSPAEKRNLPTGSVFVATFMREHAPQGVSVHDLKHHQEYAQYTTIVDRSERATRNKQEWWLTPLQQHELIQRWQEQSIAFTTCPACPHDGEAA